MESEENSAPSTRGEAGTGGVLEVEQDERDTALPIASEENIIEGEVSIVNPATDVLPSNDAMNENETRPQTSMSVNETPQTSAEEPGLASALGISLTEDGRPESATLPIAEPSATAPDTPAHADSAVETPQSQTSNSDLLNPDHTDAAAQDGSHPATPLSPLPPSDQEEPTRPSTVPENADSNNSMPSTADSEAHPMLHQELDTGLTLHQMASKDTPETEGEQVLEEDMEPKAEASLSSEERTGDEASILAPSAANEQAANSIPPPTSAPVLAEPPTDTLFAQTGLHARLDEWHHKRFLGGYRDARSDVEYFHAETQTPTPQEIRAKRAPKRFHRDTQTKFIHHRKTQATRDSSTQMTKPGCYVSTEPDRPLTPHTYTTADAHAQWIESNVIRLQCWVRRVYACRRVARLMRERDTRARALLEKERRRKELAEKRRRKEIESRLHPKTTKDFEILYNGLESWRQQETAKINAANYSEPARLAALADLLDQEAALIQKIDRLKIAANEENRERSVIRLLEAMSSSKRWPTHTPSHPTMPVDTPHTLRARELRDLYHALLTPSEIDTRLQILLHVKYTVKEFDCNLTREMVELIDREGDLTSRGRGAESMEGLRRRIGRLFLQFVMTPEFNPEAGGYQKFPDAGQSWKRDQAVYYCRSCTRYLPSTAFYLSTTLSHLGKCKPCTTAENLATTRHDDSIYADLLKLVRLQEGARRVRSGVPRDASYNAMALLQESDMRYLVERVWNRQSAVSGSRALESLVLTRWLPFMELSPWNCILLTKAEAATHDRHPDPETLYSEPFVRKILQKQLAAKKRFGSLPAMAKYLTRHYTEDSEGRLVPVPVEKT
ncbi:hypothetical protein DFS34DRAFT_627404 [Phlyctochytrium arcticum]|nr:hypothetical protein DFS34DRAFT_627404 [Phlyctochytrium arcticum]